MVERAILSALSYFLKEYFEESSFTENNLSVGLFSSGSLILENLALRKHALQALNLPIEVIHGSIDRFEFSGPSGLSAGFRSLMGSEPLIILVDGVHLVLCPKVDTWGANAFSEFQHHLSDEEMRVMAQLKEETVLASKRAKLAAMNFFSQIQSNSGEDSWSAWLTEKAIGAVIDKIEIRVKNVHIRFEDELSNKNTRFFAGLTLQSLSILPVPTEDSSHKTFGKSIKLEGLACYWNPQDSSLLSSTSLESYSHPETSTIMNSLINPIHLEDAGIQGVHHYILEPTSFEILIEMSLNPYNHIIPFAKVQLNLGTIHVSLDNVQYQGMLSLLAVVTKLQQQIEIDVTISRPKNRPLQGSAKYWWVYAFEQIRSQLRKKMRGRICWDQCKFFLQSRKEYIPLWKKVLSSGKLHNLSSIDHKTLKPEELKKLLELEDKLPFNTIMHFRWFAQCQRAEELKMLKAKGAEESFLSSAGWAGWFWSTPAERSEQKESEQLNPYTLPSLFSGRSASQDWFIFGLKLEELKLSLINKPKLPLLTQSCVPFLEAHIEGAYFHAVVKGEGAEMNVDALFVLSNFEVDELEIPENGAELSKVKILSQTALCDRPLSSPKLSSSPYSQKSFSRSHSGFVELFQLQLQTFPAGAELGAKVTLQTSPVQVIVSPGAAWIQSLASFLQPPDGLEQMGDLEQALANRIAMIQSQVEIRFEALLSKHFRVWVDVHVDTILLLLPQSPKMELDTPCLALEIGRIQLQSQHFAPYEQKTAAELSRILNEQAEMASEPTPGQMHQPQDKCETFPKMEDMRFAIWDPGFYDLVELRVLGFSACYASHTSDVVKPNKAKAGQFHLIHPINADIHFHICTVHQDPSLPNYCIGMQLPSIQLRVSKHCAQGLEILARALATQAAAAAKVAAQHSSHVALLQMIKDARTKQLEYFYNRKRSGSVYSRLDRQASSSFISCTSRNDRLFSRSVRQASFSFISSRSRASQKDDEDSFCSVENQVLSVDDFEPSPTISPAIDLFQDGFFLNDNRALYEPDFQFFFCELQVAQCDIAVLGDDLTNGEDDPHPLMSVHALGMLCKSQFGSHTTSAALLFRDFNVLDELQDPSMRVVAESSLPSGAPEQNNHPLAVYYSRSLGTGGNSVHDAYLKMADVHVNLEPRNLLELTGELLRFLPHTHTEDIPPHPEPLSDPYKLSLPPLLFSLSICVNRVHLFAFEQTEQVVAAHFPGCALGLNRTPENLNAFFFLDDLKIVHFFRGVTREIYGKRPAVKSLLEMSFQLENDLTGRANLTLEQSAILVEVSSLEDIIRYATQTTSLFQNPSQTGPNSVPIHEPDGYAEMKENQPELENEPAEGFGLIAGIDTLGQILHRPVNVEIVIELKNTALTIACSDFDCFEMSPCSKVSLDLGGIVVSTSYQSVGKRQAVLAIEVALIGFQVLAEQECRFVVLEPVFLRGLCVVPICSSVTNTDIDSLQAREFTRGLTVSELLIAQKTTTALPARPELWTDRRLQAQVHVAVTSINLRAGAVLFSVLDCLGAASSVLLTSQMGGARPNSYAAPQSNALNTTSTNALLTKLLRFLACVPSKTTASTSQAIFLGIVQVESICLSIISSSAPGQHHPQEVEVPGNILVCMSDLAAACQVAAQVQRSTADLECDFEFTTRSTFCGETGELPLLAPLANRALLVPREPPGTFSLLPSSRHCQIAVQMKLACNKEASVLIETGPMKMTVVTKTIAHAIEFMCETMNAFPLLKKLEKSRGLPSTGQRRQLDQNDAEEQGKNNEFSLDDVVKIFLANIKMLVPVLTVRAKMTYFEFITPGKEFTTAVARCGLQLNVEVNSTQTVPESATSVEQFICAQFSGAGFELVLEETAKKSTKQRSRSSFQESPLLRGSTPRRKYGPGISKERAIELKKLLSRFKLSRKHFDSSSTCQVVSPFAFNIEYKVCPCSELDQDLRFTHDLAVTLGSIQLHICPDILVLFGIAGDISNKIWDSLLTKEKKPRGWEEEPANKPLPLDNCQIPHLKVFCMFFQTLQLPVLSDLQVAKCLFQSTGQLQFNGDGLKIFVASFSNSQTPFLRFHIRNIEVHAQKDPDQCIGCMKVESGFLEQFNNALLAWEPLVEPLKIDIDAISSTTTRAECAETIAQKEPGLKLSILSSVVRINLTELQLENLINEFYSFQYTFMHSSAFYSEFLKGSEFGGLKISNQTGSDLYFCVDCDPHFFDYLKHEGYSNFGPDLNLLPYCGKFPHAEKAIEIFDETLSIYRIVSLRRDSTSFKTGFEEAGVCMGLEKNQNNIIEEVTLSSQLRFSNVSFIPFDLSIVDDSSEAVWQARIGFNENVNLPFSMIKATFKLNIAPVAYEFSAFSHWEISKPDLSQYKSVEFKLTDFLGIYSTPTIPDILEFKAADVRLPSIFLSPLREFHPHTRQKTIHLRPALTFLNSTQYALTVGFGLQCKNLNTNISSTTLRLQALGGQEIQCPFFAPDSSLDVTLDLPGFAGDNKITLAGVRSGAQHCGAQYITVENEYGNRFLLSASFLQSSSQRKVNLFMPCCIHNYTDIPFEFQFTPTLQAGESRPPQTERIETGSFVPISINECNLKEKELGALKLRAEKSKWSKKIRAGREKQTTVWVPKEEGVGVGESTSQGGYAVYVCVEKLPLDLEPIRHIKLYPAYVLQNKLGQPIEVYHSGNEGKNTIHSNESRSVVFKGGTLHHRIHLRPAASDWCISPAIDLDNMLCNGRIYQIQHSERGTVLFFSIDLSRDATSGTILAVVSPAASARALFSVQNETHEEIMVWQKNTESWYCILPYHEVSLSNFGSESELELWNRSLTACDDTSVDFIAKISTRSFCKLASKTHCLKMKKRGNSQQTILSVSSYQKGRTLKKMCQISNLEQMSFEVNLCFFVQAVEINIVDRLPQELLFCRVSGLSLKYDLHQVTNEYARAAIESFQIDNQLFFSKFPVMFQSLPHENLFPGKSNFVVVEAKSNLECPTSCSLTFDMIFSPIQINLDMCFVNKLYEMIQRLSCVYIQFQKDDNGTDLHLPTTLEHDNISFVSKHALILKVHPLDITFSCFCNYWAFDQSFNNPNLCIQPSFLRVMLCPSASLLNVKQAHLFFRELQLSTSQNANWRVYFFVLHTLLQLSKIPLSLELFGNPAFIFKGLSGKLLKSETLHTPTSLLSRTKQTLCVPFQWFENLWISFFSGSERVFETALLQISVPWLILEDFGNFRVAPSNPFNGIILGLVGIIRNTIHWNHGQVIARPFIGALAGLTGFFAKVLYGFLYFTLQGNNRIKLVWMRMKRQNFKTFQTPKLIEFERLKCPRAFLSQQFQTIQQSSTFQELTYATLYNECWFTTCQTQLLVLWGQKIFVVDERFPHFMYWELLCSNIFRTSSDHKKLEIKIEFWAEKCSSLASDKLQFKECKLFCNTEYHVSLVVRAISQIAACIFSPSSF